MIDGELYGDVEPAVQNCNACEGIQVVRHPQMVADADPL